MVTEAAEAPGKGLFMVCVLFDYVNCLSFREVIDWRRAEQTLLPLLSLLMCHITRGLCEDWEESLHLLASPKYQACTPHFKTQNEALGSLVPTLPTHFLLKVITYHLFSFVFITKLGPWMQLAEALASDK